MHHIFSLATVILLVAQAGAAFAQGSISGTAFNPALSFILDGKFTSYSGLPPVLSGVLQGEESEPPHEGFSLSDTELVASANIDDKFYGFVSVGSHIDENVTEVELEEAWIQTLGLPYGLGVKAGRFFSDIGYHNIRHSHTWDFVTAPLPYAVFLGTTYADTGVQVRWLAPTDLFVEIGGELMSGESFPAGGAANDGVGGKTLFARVGGDFSVSHSWRAGVSFIAAESLGRESLAGDTLVSFDGDTDVSIVDFVWKWARNGNPREENFTIVAEYLQRDEGGVLSGDGPPGFTTPYADAQDGLYVYGTYQFRSQWRVGLRYDQLSLDTTLGALPGLVPGTSDPRRLSVMVDWSNSEYSRLRAQIDESDFSGQSSTAFFVQYIMSLGAHGAHAF
jgi:hypothetical protein